MSLSYLYNHRLAARMARRASNVIVQKRARRTDPDVTDSEDEEEFGYVEGETALVHVTGDGGLNLFPYNRDFGEMSMKHDASHRPLWVCPNGRVYLEVANAFYKQASDFLVAISEPVCRPEHVHEYQMTPFSLYAAASLGLETHHIIQTLNRLSKVEVPPRIVAYVTEHTEKCGKVKLVLRRTRYFVESIFPDILNTLLGDEVVAGARIDHLKPHERPVLAIAAPVVGPGAKEQKQEGKRFNTRVALADAAQDDRDDPRDDETGFLVSYRPDTELVLPGSKDGRIDIAAAVGLSEDDMQVSVSDKDKPILAFEIQASQVESVRRRCITNLKYPMLEEYDFRHDTSTPDLTELKLRPIARIREYQEKSLSKMFGNGRARSGIIVLPCGAGKTLVGITATATVKKSTLVFCTTAVAVEQWKRQFLLWTELPEKYICVFTANAKDQFNTEAMIVITTYNMVGHTGVRSKASAEAMKVLTTHEWGLIVLDEVHVAPASQFRKCVSVTHSRCKLGLTATLVREDDLIKDLFFLVGPKLYEANWLDLQEAGYLATVQCVEVWCSMTAEFYRAYLQSSAAKQALLYVMNPNKFRTCEYLIRLHEARGDKVLVFSDNVFALKTYAEMLRKPYIYGGTSTDERMQFLQQFQHNPQINTLFISKIGDNSIDLPDVNVIIQISSHFASRRQEAQRLGRILRPKTKNASANRFNAWFYTLVSTDTKEMHYAARRQRFLVDQGYSFKVVSEIPDMASVNDLQLSDPKSQYDVLCRVMQEDEKSGETEIEPDDPYTVLESERTRKAIRKKSTLAALTGGDGRQYAEFAAREEVRKERKKQSGSGAGRPQAKKKRL